MTSARSAAAIGLPPHEDQSFAQSSTALAAVLAAASTKLPDGNLIRLGADLETEWAEELALYVRFEGDESPYACHVINEQFEKVSEIVDELEALAATTLGGLIVKARAFMWCQCMSDGGVPVPANATTDERLARGILRDLLRLQAARAAA